MGIGAHAAIAPPDGAERLADTLSCPSSRDSDGTVGMFPRRGTDIATLPAAIRLEFVWGMIGGLLVRVVVVMVADVAVGEIRRHGMQLLFTESRELVDWAVHGFRTGRLCRDLQFWLERRGSPSGAGD